MLGWFSAEATLASCRNRFSRPSSAAKLGSSVLMATQAVQPRVAGEIDFPYAARAQAGPNFIVAKLLLGLQSDLIESLAVGRPETRRNQGTPRPARQTISSILS